MRLATLLSALLILSAIGCAQTTPTPAGRVLWNGDPRITGTPRAGDKPTTNPAITIGCELDREGPVRGTIAIHGEGPGWIGGLWPLDEKGIDISGYANLVLQLKAEGKSKLQAVGVRLFSPDDHMSKSINAADYLDSLVDGEWHEVVLPMKDMTPKTSFDPKALVGIEVRGYSWATQQKNFTIYIRHIGVDNRPAQAHSDPIVMPVARAPRAISATAPSVTAEVDIAAPGKPISPYIYGAACDPAAAKAAGLTIIRYGGNPASTVNWKEGFWSSGNDWYMVNNPTKTKPGPLAERMSGFGNLKKDGLELYLTMAIMGRVAKDGTSVGFDIRKYPNQTTWEGKEHPGDQHPYAGSGVQFVLDENGKQVLDDKGKPKTKPIPPNPDDVSIPMSADDQCAMLSYLVKDMGYGRASEGGLKFLCMDNEPMIWHTTHKCFHPEPCSYDEYWKRTVDYASRLKKIDPSIKIAGPAAFGWTEYLYSGLDAQLCNDKKGSWDSPPDYTAHGKVYFAKWWMKQLAAYEKEHGVRLVDLLDWHFYPQAGGKTAEDRVQETRVLWDPTWKDASWMGSEMGKVIRLIPLMKEWIAECNPGMQTAIGEYAFGGDGDVSGGVCQSEILGIFAREGLDHAYMWGGPGMNGSIYFGYKMFRNPDGKYTAFGDQYLPSKVSAPDDVSVHTARDKATGRLTFILVNKRGAKDSKVTLKLSKPIKEQETTPYEYSATSRWAIGQLPAMKVGGESITVELPAMSVIRFDLNP